jgi:hypothetical protein
MKNTDYVIYVTTKHGQTYRYSKEDNGWTQTAPTGRVRRLSAEQLLSHLLPPLAGDQPGLSVRVEPIDNRGGLGDSSPSLNRRVVSSP